jgi:UDP-3-O-[3-hydroxymyristoyl] glucosamine N-acyltransferase
MMRTSAEVSQAVGAKLEGDGGLELQGVAAPERAGPRDLIYVDSRKHEARALASAALCVIAGESVGKGFQWAGKTILRSGNPKWAFANAAALLTERAPIATGIHATAIIAPLAHVAPDASIGPYAVVAEDAHVGAGTQIGPHCVIGAGSWIGEGCRIHARVTLYPGVRVGNRVEIHSGAVIGADGFGYAQGKGRYWKFPQQGIVEISDDVEIGANTTIDRGSLDDTRIGEGVKLDNLVHVAHNVKIGAHTAVAAQAGFSGSCTVGAGVVVGGQAGFGEQCQLEDGAIIGGQAGVLGGKTIRSGQIVWGTPARPLAKFKEQFAWFSRLPELAARLRKLEDRGGDT